MGWEVRVYEVSGSREAFDMCVLEFLKGKGGQWIGGLDTSVDFPTSKGASCSVWDSIQHVSLQTTVISANWI